MAVVSWHKSLSNWMLYKGPESVQDVAAIDPSGHVTLDGEKAIYERDGRKIVVRPGMWVAWAFHERKGGFMIAFSNWNDVIADFSNLF